MKNLFSTTVVIGIMLLIPFPALFVEITYGVLFISSITILLIIQIKDVFPSFSKLSLILTLLDLVASISFTKIILISRMSLTFQQLSVFNISYIINILVAIVILVCSLIFIKRKKTYMNKVAAHFILDLANQRLFNIDSKLYSNVLSQEEAESLKTKLASEIHFVSRLDGSLNFLFGNLNALCFIFFITLVGGTFIDVYLNGHSIDVALNTISFAALGNLAFSIIPLILLSISMNRIIKKQIPQISIVL